MELIDDTLYFGAAENINLGELVRAHQGRGVRGLAKLCNRPGDFGRAERFDTLDPLVEFEGLALLNLSWETEIGDITALACLPQLRVVRLGVVTGDLAPLRSCGGLVALALTHASLVDLAPLLPLAATLESLDLQESPVASLAGIEAFARLTTLGVDARCLPLAGLAPLAHAPSLRTLDYRGATVPRDRWPQRDGLVINGRRRRQVR